MRIVWSVFKKESLDTLRDRRAVIAMIIIPMALFPVLFGGIGIFAIKEVKKAQEKQVRIGLVQPLTDNALIERFKTSEGFAVSRLDSEADPVERVVNSKVDAAIAFQSDFADQLTATGAGKMTLYFRSTGNGGIFRGRIMEVVNDYRKEVRDSRIQSLGYTLDFVNPVDVEFVNTASEQEQIGEAIGGFIPYLFIILCFTGAMYPAIDLGAGEKERGTLETLLTSSAPLSQVLMGKLLVTICSGLLAASLSLSSMAMAVVFMASRIGDLPSAIGPMLQPMNMALFFSLLLLLTIFFAAFLLALSFFAKSFKEAQSIISPLMAATFLPLIIGMMPWVKLTYFTAMVPVLNISLASKAIFSGKVDWGPTSLVYVSLAVLASLGFIACAKFVKRENVLFRI